MKFSKIPAVLLCVMLSVTSAGMAVSADSGNAASAEISRIVSVDEPGESIGISPVNTGMGNGSAAVSFKNAGKNYSYTLYFIDGKKRYRVKPQGNGFVYISGLKKGKHYPAYIEATDSERTFREEFILTDSADSAPLIYAEKASKSRLMVKWKDFAEGSTYIVYRRTPKGWKKLAETSKNYYIDKGLKSGTLYTYRVFVKGTGELIRTEEVTLSAHTVPSEAAGLTADLNKGVLSWKSVRGADGYCVYKKVGGKYKLAAKVKTNSYSISTKKMTSYAVAAYVTDPDGTERVGKKVCSAAEADGKALPLYPQKLKLKEASNSAVQLSWDKAAAGAEYSIYYSKSPTDDYKLISTTKGTSFKVTGLQALTTYYFTVSYSYKGTKSAYAPAVTQYFMPLEPLPEYPMNLDVSVNEKKLTASLKWSSVGSNVRYAVYMSTDPKGKYKKVLTTYSSNCTITKLSKGQTYYFSVRYLTEREMSPLSPAFEVFTAEYRTLKNNAYLMSAGSWASDKLAVIPAGTSVPVTGRSGKFYRCRYGNTTGYIYNLAVDNITANVTLQTLTESNLDTFADDILYSIGNDTKAIWTYVNSLKYSAARTDSRITDVNTLMKYYKTLSVDMLKKRSGLCYHYAALSAELLKRAGYKSALVYCPHKSNGFHCYNTVQVNGKWTYFDACRHATKNELGYLPNAPEFISARNLDKDKEQVSAMVV